MFGAKFIVAKLDEHKLEKAVAAADEQMKMEMAKRGKEIIDNYWATGGPREDPWLALAQFTRDKKGHDTILYETGDLWSSNYYRKNAKGNWEFGVEDPKAVYHEYGYINHLTGVWVPARPMMQPALRQVKMEFSQKLFDSQKSFKEKIAECFNETSSG